MSLKKNISGGPLDVPLLGRSVEADEVVQVPDFQPAHSDENPLPVTWPPDKWQDVADGTPPGVPAGDGTLSITLDSADPHFAAADDASHEGM